MRQVAEDVKIGLLIKQLQNKMRSLADEFASGEINREQFHRVYEHYQQQLNLATAAQLDNMQLEGVEPGETVAIRRQHAAMARAAVVYHHQTGEFWESVGDLEVTTEALLPTLKSISEQVQTTEGALPDPVTAAVGKAWVVYIPGEFSTAVMVFSNEPVARQIEIVQNMHRDFEIANQAALRTGQTSVAKLVYPFLSFVRRSVTRPKK
jgi:hypothetical protein